MPKNISFTEQEQNLLRRYLIWCYKTTKEELDRIDRYFTQAIVDDYFIKRLKSLSQYKTSDSAFCKKVEDFVLYSQEKKAKAQEKKFVNVDKKTLQPDYNYLKSRLEVIEQAICHFFNKKELKKIIALYEGEMTERILKARDHS